MSQGVGSLAAMSRWWTSDHHFGHANIIKYCNRPFADADEMNKAMVNRWNDLVAEGDEVWIVGDLVLGQLTVNLSAHVWRLKGRKILVPGNHDACWQGQKKGRRQVTPYLDLGGIARIVDDPEPVEIAGQRVQVNHFPYDPGEPGRPARFAQWRPEDVGGWLLCGHIHERVAPARQTDQRRRRRLELRARRRRHHRKDDRHRPGAAALPRLRPHPLTSAARPARS